MLQDKHAFNALDSKFGTAPTQAVVPVTPTAEPAEIQDDFEKARSTLRALLDKGEAALDGMMDVAKQSDHPRAFEVTGQLIKTVADTAKDLLALQKTKKELQTPEEVKQQQIGTQNNIVFQGSTSELIDLMRAKKKAEVIDVQSPEQTKL
jgi:hypothetical protein